MQTERERTRKGYSVASASHGKTYSYATPTGVRVSSNGNAESISRDETRRVEARASDALHMYMHTIQSSHTLRLRSAWTRGTSEFTSEPQIHSPADPTHKPHLYRMLGARAWASYKFLRVLLSSPLVGRPALQHPCCRLSVLSFTTGVQTSDGTSPEGRMVAHAPALCGRHASQCASVSPFTSATVPSPSSTRRHGCSLVIMPLSSLEHT